MDFVKYNILKIFYMLCKLLNSKFFAGAHSIRFVSFDLTVFEKIL